MSDFLIKHAINNVWCNPKQDSQMVLKPARLTAPGGVVRSWKFMWISFNLPNNTDRFHVYSVGQISPLLVNLFPGTSTWRAVSESNNLTNTLTEIYTQAGIRIPASRVYYIFTEEKNLLFAIPRDSKLKWDFNQEEVYVRLYDNAYFASGRNTSTGIFVTGGKMKSTQDILDIQNTYNLKAALPGKVYAFVNGYRVKNIGLISVAVNDTVEFYHDPSVSNTYKFKLNQLDVFDSLLDTKRKYFLHTGAGLGDSIYYQDDVDVYILNESSEKGVYYHRNSADNLRMVTHKDYSLSQPVTSAYLTQHTDIFDYGSAVIEVNVRQSGYSRPLIDEHLRIKELYKLPVDKIYTAMIGAQSSLDNWRVDTLENSNYTKLMRSPFSEITENLVKDTYGYNAVVKAVANPVIKTQLFSGQTVGILPHHYLTNCTVYEYDQNGVYIDKYYHPTGQIYNCINQNAGYLYLIHGNWSDTLDEYYNVQNLTLDDNYEYRFYAAQKDNVHVGTRWQDVTGTSMYVKIGNNVTWLVTSTHDVLIRSNKVHLSKSFYIDPLGGSITFNLSHVQNVQGVTMDAVMQIPMGELKVFLNKRPLVRGFDYYVNFPVVTITNKDYLVAQSTTQQHVEYVFTGLCNESMGMRDYSEAGFINNGYLSVDNRFDVRDDKVNYIVAAGRIYLKEDLNFLEDSNQFIFNSAMNGKPYCVEDIVVPIKSVTGLDTYDYKDLSLTVDNAVSDYLSLHMPAPVIPGINTIPSYYKLYSPFISKVIFSVIDNVIDPNVLIAHYNDDKIREVVAPFLYLLDMDPIHVDNRPDMNYCIIHPHILSNVIEVNIHQYRFITRVVNLYGNGLINLSGHLAMV